MTTNLQREKKCPKCERVFSSIETFVLHNCYGKPTTPPTDTTKEKWRLEFVKIRERNYKEKWGDQVALVEEIQFIEKLIALSLQQAREERDREWIKAMKFSLPYPDIDVITKKLDLLTKEEDK